MAARVDTSLTSLARSGAQHNEDQVLAARAHESELRVTWVRLVLLGLMAVSQGVIGGITDETDAGDDARGLAVTLYAAFTVAAFFMVRRRRRLTLRRVRVMPAIATTFDLGFLVAMDYIDHRFGAVQLESTVAMLPLIMSYSLLRFSGYILLHTSALAVAAFTAALVWSGEFTWSRWSFVVFTLVALALLLAGTRRSVRRAFVDLKRREDLSRLVPPKVVDEILAGREDGLRPARREVTVLFADIRGFTTYSESRPPEEVLRFLDDYFGRMTQVVQGHDGSVNKFLGDGLLALWGAPVAQADHPARAVRAALDMQRVMTELAAARAAAGEVPLRIGVGVHTGEVAVGMLGSAGQSEYSVIGDAVNLASRIEGLTKTLGAGLLVSEATWSRLGGAFAGERLGEVAVAGRRAPVVLYALATPPAAG